MEFTFGQKAVRLNANLPQNESTKKMKQRFADIIDELNNIRNATSDGEVKRVCSVAITEAQTAQMWAVLAINLSE